MESAMQVYRLIAIEVSDRHSSGDGYDSFVNEIGVFSAVAKAEEMIRIHAERVKTYAKILGYALYENTLDDFAPHGPWGGTPKFLSVRTYLADGTLNASCDCDDTCERHWYGRKEATIRYKPGDFVSVWHGGTINTELVGDVPVTTQRKFVGDWSDDCYLTYQAKGGHGHPFSPYVFPLVDMVPEQVKVRLIAVRDNEELQD